MLDRGDRSRRELGRMNVRRITAVLLVPVLLNPVAVIAALPPPRSVTPVVALPALEQPIRSTRSLDERPSWMLWGGSLVLVGGGLVAIGIGAWNGVQALDLGKQAKPDCGTGIYDDFCGPTGLAYARRGIRHAFIADTAIWGGTMALAIGFAALTLVPRSWSSLTEELPAVSVQPLDGGAMLRLGWAP